MERELKYIQEDEEIKLLYLPNFHNVTTTYVEGKVFTKGRVATEQGFVVVESILSQTGNCRTFLFMIHKGRFFQRTLHIYRNKENLLELAKEFSVDCVRKVEGL